MSRRSPALTGPAPAPHPRVAVIPRYQPGRTAEATMAAHGLTSAVKLASNESPFGPLPGVLDAVAAATGDSGRYPDHLAETLRATLAARHGVDADQVAVGCGSVGMLQQLLLSYAGPGHEVLFPLAVVHRLPAVQPAGRRHRRRGPADRVGHGRGRAARGAVTPRTAMVLIANPNNPTSTALRTAALTRLVEALPATCCSSIDEAYREYVTDPDVPDALDHFGDRPNVVVLRTFSKAWALAGLRVGYLVGDPVGRARGRRHAHALLGQHARPGRRPRRARAARGGGAAGRGRRGRAGAGQQRRWPAGGCPSRTARATSCGCRPVRRAAALAEAMERRGVVTRPFPSGIRVTMGLGEDNDRFLAALADCARRGARRRDRVVGRRRRGVAAMAATAATAAADGSRPR